MATERKRIEEKRNCVCVKRIQAAAATVGQQRTVTTLSMVVLFLLNCHHTPVWVVLLQKYQRLDSFPFLLFIPLEALPTGAMGVFGKGQNFSKGNSDVPLVMVTRQPPMTPLCC